MRIFVNYKTKKTPFGGALQFLGALKESLSNNKITIVDSINDDYEILLINGFNKGPGEPINIKEIINLKKYGFTNCFDYFFRGTILDSNLFPSNILSRFYNMQIFNSLNKLFSRQRKISFLYRLDGFRAIYNNKDNLTKITNTDLIQIQLFKLSDFIIFQSLYSLNCSIALGYKGQNYKTINNGVNQSLFYPNLKNEWVKGEKLKIITASWSWHKNKGFDLISKFSECNGVEISFFGNWPSDVSNGQVQVFDPQKPSELAEKYRDNHVLLLPSKFESCSNTALEALSSGLPIIFLQSGSNTEICGSYGIPIKLNDLQGTIKQMKLKYHALRSRLISDNAKFGISKASRSYEKVMKKLINARTT